MRAVWDIGAVDELAAPPTPVFFLAGGTGISAETLGNLMLAQFQGQFHAWGRHERQPTPEPVKPPPVVRNDPPSNPTKPPPADPPPTKPTTGTRVSADSCTISTVASRKLLCKPF